MDSRSFRRRSIAIHFRVFDAVSGEFIGRIGDISEGGMLVYGPRRLKAKAPYRLRIELPARDGGHHPVMLEARAMWSGVDVNPEFFSSGLRFIGLDEAGNRVAADALIAHLTRDDERTEERRSSAGAARTSSHGTASQPMGARVKTQASPRPDRPLHDTD